MLQFWVLQLVLRIQVHAGTRGKGHRQRINTPVTVFLLEGGSLIFVFDIICANRVKFINNNLICIHILIHWIHGAIKFGKLF